MPYTVRDTLRGDRPEVLDVVGDYSPAFRGRGPNHPLVVLSDELGSLLNCLSVEPSIA